MQITLMQLIPTLNLRDITGVSLPSLCLHTCLRLDIGVGVCCVYLALLRPRWGSIALQMGERAKTSDDGRSDHSQPRELLTLITSRRVDVGLSFVLCSINRSTLPGLL